YARSFFSCYVRASPDTSTLSLHDALPISFDEDWERMNAMNWVFVPHGLTAAVLERYFRRAYRAFYLRPDVLWGLARTLAGEPRYLRRLVTYVRVGMADWLLAAPAQSALVS